MFISLLSEPYAFLQLHFPYHRASGKVSKCLKACRSFIHFIKPQLSPISLPQAHNCSPPRFPLDCSLLSPPSLSFTLVLPLLWQPPATLSLSGDTWAPDSSLSAQFTKWMATLNSIGMQKHLCGESLAPLETQLLRALVGGRNHPILMPSECRIAEGWA